MKKRTGYVFKRGTHYYCQWRVDGKTFIQRLNNDDGEPVTNTKDAEQARQKLMVPFSVSERVEALEMIQGKLAGAKEELAIIEDERNPALMISQAWITFEKIPGKIGLKKRPVDPSPETLEVYLMTWERFQRWMTEKYPEVKYLRDVTPEIAAEYAEHLNGRGITGGTFNKHISLLNLVFHVLRKKARLAINPWDEVGRRNVIQQGRRELTLDELKTVCESATGDLRLLFALGIYTGMRLGDCATLRWGEVDLQRGIIRRMPNKTKRKNPKPLIVPIHPVLKIMLTDISADDRTDYVLPRIAEDYKRHHSYVTDRVQKHFEDCKIRTRKADKEGRLLALVEVGFHSLRHSFISLSREANTPLSVVESLVGHSNPAMTRHYSHTSEDAAATAINGLPSVHGGDIIKALPPADPLTIFKAKIKELVSGMTAKTWKKTQADILAIIEVK